jgi:hypothetical protein
VNDPLTDFAYLVDATFSGGAPIPSASGIKRVTVMGTYHGQRVWVGVFASDELLSDPVPLDSFLKAAVLAWAQENVHALPGVWSVAE